MIRPEQKFGSKSYSSPRPAQTTADIFVFSQITFLRKVYGSRLNVFAPVNDLSTLSGETRALTAGQSNDVAIAGGQILGDEYSDHVIKVGMGPYLH